MSGVKELRVSGVVLIAAFLLGAGLVWFLDCRYGIAGRVAPRETVVDVASLVSAMGGLLGTFVGVAFAFGISGGGVAFRNFRRAAGAALIQTWTSLIYASFSVSFIGIVAVIFFAYGADRWAISALGGALSLFVLMAINTVWIVKVLAKVGQSDDYQADKDEVGRDYLVSSEMRGTSENFRALGGDRGDGEDLGDVNVFPESNRFVASDEGKSGNGDSGEAIDR